LYWVSDVWSARERTELEICEKELFASNAGLAVIVSHVGVSLVHEFTDNTVALAVMRSLTPRTERMQLLVARRVQQLEARAVRATAHRISSKNNLWADMGSRGHALEVVAQAESLGLRTVQLRMSVEQRATGWLLRARSGNE